MNRFAACPLMTFCALLFSTGCATGPQEPMSDYTRETGNVRIDVPEDWRRFALANYAGEALVELQSAGNVRFLQPPIVTASRNLKSGRVELMVIGELDETNIRGDRLRHPFVVVWRQAGGGWQLVDREVQPGKAAPIPSRPLDAPPAAPATVPSAVPPTDLPPAVPGVP